MFEYNGQYLDQNGSCTNITYDLYLTGDLETSEIALTHAVGQFGDQLLYYNGTATSLSAAHAASPHYVPDAPVKCRRRMLEVKLPMQD